MQDPTTPTTTTPTEQELAVIGALRGLRDGLDGIREDVEQILRSGEGDLRALAQEIARLAAITRRAPRTLEPGVGRAIAVTTTELDKARLALDALAETVESRAKARAAKLRTEPAALDAQHLDGALAVHSLRWAWHWAGEAVDIFESEIPF
ncbi:MAG: hypothetical protein KC457_00970 [Myxococcales bacterium]|nr:hypothetical protein [Myxococcales bacterium]